MSTTQSFKRNDTGPPIVITCLDGDLPMNLTGATSAKFIMGTISSTGVNFTKVSALCTFNSDRATGRVTYDWAVNDLNTAGEYKAEVEVTWASGDIQTFPADDYLTIVVIPDVG
jgi:hypothetical protein